MCACEEKKKKSLEYCPQNHSDTGSSEKWNRDFIHCHIFKGIQQKYVIFVISIFKEIEKRKNERGSFRIKLSFKSQFYHLLRLVEVL